MLHMRQHSKYYIRARRTLTRFFQIQHKPPLKSPSAVRPLYARPSQMIWYVEIPDFLVESNNRRVGRHLCAVHGNHDIVHYTCELDSPHIDCRKGGISTAHPTRKEIEHA
jgi:hypothetical protein